MLAKPILCADAILLRPICVEDAQLMFDSQVDAEINRLTGTYEHFTLEQARAYCERVAEADDRVDYAIVSKSDEDLVFGEVVLNDISWHNRCANFRIALYYERYLGKGYGTQATQLILQYGFESLDLHRIELEVYAFNPRAAHVYEKVGFLREGVRRDALLWEGVYCDAILMAMLKADYEKAQEAH